MGANFVVDKLPPDTSPADAFTTIQTQACWDWGDTGYTGTIAEANGFEVVKDPFPTYEAARIYAKEMAQKWGPALCVTLTNGDRYFMGWYSS